MSLEFIAGYIQLLIKFNYKRRRLCLLQYLCNLEGTRPAVARALRRPPACHSLSNAVNLSVMWAVPSDRLDLDRLDMEIAKLMQKWLERG